MWTHFFTLRALAKELNAVLAAATTSEIFTQRKNELLISIGAADADVHTANADHTLDVSINPELNFLFLRDRVRRARKNSVDLFPEAVGTRIRSVSTGSQDRIVSIDLSNDLQFCLQLFGTAASNVFLVGEHGIIKNAFKNSKYFVGKRFSIIREQDYEEMLASAVSFSSEIRKKISSTIFDSLKTAIPVLGSTFAREILHRSGIDERAQVHLLNDDDYRNMHARVKSLLDETQPPRPTVYFRDNDPRVFSVIPLQHLSGMRVEHFPSVNDAIRTLAAQSSRTHEIELRKKDFIHKLKREYDRTMRTLAAIQQEAAAGRGRENERIANILMANLQHLTKGTKFIALEDIFSPNKRPVRITLDPKRTPVQNAEQYFEKAKKSRAAEEDLSRGLGTLKVKQALLEKLLLHLDYCQTKEQLDEFQQEHKAQLLEWKIVSAGGAREQLPFRSFKVNGDFEVWVGKSSDSNDLLTMKYAKPNDLWFHVRGASGSHVVLKVGTGKTQPSRQAISQAASIAAYYSKMKNAGTVPIAYCLRKYIRKPKGAQAGSVVMEREKLIFVEPGLP